MKYDKNKFEIIDKQVYKEGMEDGFIYHNDIKCYTNNTIPENAICCYKDARAIPKTMFKIPFKIIDGMKDNVLECAWCHKELTKDMEVEYSNWLTAYYCCPDCAMSAYFEYCDSIPVDMTRLKDYGLKALKDGKLIEIEDSKI